jgi:co-chaperonin GroES (HSP10)
MYKKSDSDTWNAVDPFVFVKPIPVETKTLPNGLVVETESYKNMKHLQGTIAYPNKELEKLGVKVGDKIGFQEHSQHEYVVDGELYYRMTSKDILAVY